MILWLRRTPRKQIGGISPPRASDQIEFQQKLRERVLTGSIEEFGIDPARMYKGTWGVIMEIGYQEGTATLVCLCDGSTSLYLGQGGGIVGGQSHEAVRVAAARFLRLASDHTQDMKLTEAHPMPEVGQVRFYAMTDSGVLTAKEDEQSLGGGDHRLSPLFFAGHGVITQLRGTAEEPDPSREEMNDLLDNGMRSAIHFLEKSGGFYPFGVALRADGKIAHVAAWDGKSEHPQSDDILALLYQALRQGAQKGEYKAVAIVTAMTIPKTPTDTPRDAVRVQIEHPDAAPVACFLPYSIERGKCVQGTLTAERCEPLIIGYENHNG